MIFGRCKSRAPWYDYRCQRKANHLGAHTHNSEYHASMMVWFTCVECGISTAQAGRVCTHCAEVPR